MNSTLPANQPTPRHGEIARFYAENGFYAYPDALSPTEVEQLRDEAVRI